MYWNGLKVLGICLFPGSQAEYHRSLDRRGCRAAAPRRTTTGRSSVGSRAPGTRVSPARRHVPLKASFALTNAEARYLKGRVLENHRRSLFAFMLDRDYVDAEAPSPGSIRRRRMPRLNCAGRLDHARCFSEVMNGAAILYNLYLGEMDPRRDKVDRGMPGLPW